MNKLIASLDEVEREAEAVLAYVWAIKMRANNILRKDSSKEEQNEIVKYKTKLLTHWNSVNEKIKSIIK